MGLAGCTEGGEAGIWGLLSGEMGVDGFGCGVLAWEPGGRACGGLGALGGRDYRTSFLDLGGFSLGWRCRLLWFWTSENGWFGASCA